MRLVSFAACLCRGFSFSFRHVFLLDICRIECFPAVIGAVISSAVRESPEEFVPFGLREEYRLRFKYHGFSAAEWRGGRGKQQVDGNIGGELDKVDCARDRVGGFCDRIETVAGSAVGDGGCA